MRNTVTPYYLYEQPIVYNNQVREFPKVPTPQVTPSVSQTPSRMVFFNGVNYDCNRLGFSTMNINNQTN